MKGLNSINLINSMLCDRAEINTRGNVMLTGENDAGKTAALRLWVYFITGSRDMLGIDKKSNQCFAGFYFPKPNSYIIYEMFDNDHRYMIILSCRNGVIYSRYVDLPYSREYFFDEEDQAYVRWEDIADKIGPKASDFMEVCGEDNFRAILFGSYKGPKASDYRRFSLVQSNNSDGLRKAVLGVFLNSELVETRKIRDFILEAMSLSDRKVDISRLKHLIQPVNDQYQDILYWNEVDEKNNMLRLQEAKLIIDKYEQKIQREVTIAQAWNKLNYIIPRNSRRQQQISENIGMLTARRKEINSQKEKKEGEYTGIITTLSAPVHEFEGSLKKLESDHRYYHENSRQIIIRIFNDKDRILKDLVARQEEYNSLTELSGDINKRYEDMTVKVLKPYFELRDKWESRITELQQKNRDESTKIEGGYTEECRKLEVEHSKNVSDISSAISQTTSDIITLQGELYKSEKESLFASRRSEIAKERSEHEKKASSLEKEIRAIDSLITTLQTDCQHDIDVLKAEKMSLWRQSEERLDSSVNETKARLEGLDDSLIKFLEANKPGWEDNIGKVISDDILFSKGLSPSMADDGNTLYGVSLDLQKKEISSVSIDEMQKNLQKMQKELDNVRTWMSNPEMALQSEIMAIEERYSKKIIPQRKDKTQKTSLLNDETNHLSLLHEEEMNLDKRERTQKDIKAREINAKISKKEEEKKQLEGQLDFENGENGHLKRLADAATRRDILLKELERYVAEIDSLQGSVKDQKSKIESERVRIQEMKMKELADNNIDSKRVAALEHDIQDLLSKKKILESEDNIVMYGKWSEFLDEYTKKEYWENQLDAARGKLQSFIDEHKRIIDEWDSQIERLDSEINSEKGRLTSIKKELNDTLNYISNPVVPSHLLSSEQEETEELASNIIDVINKNVTWRIKDLTGLKDCIQDFVHPFHMDNVYGIKKMFNIGDDNMTDYCDFAEWLKRFIANETWKQNEEVSYTQFNDIIKEAGHECQEAEILLEKVEKIKDKINGDLKNLNFSKIDYIQFQIRDSGNAVYKIIKKMSRFYEANVDVIEKEKMGIFSQMITEEDVKALRPKAMELIKQLSAELNKDSSSEISFKDTFEMDVRGSENGNPIPWTMSFMNFGSKGTSFVARTLINFVLIDVFKKNLESPQDFIIHCVMDEVGSLDKGNKKGVRDFANSKNIYLVQAVPEALNGSDYTYVYFIQNINGKCKFNKVIS